MDRINARETQGNALGGKVGRAVGVLGARLALELMPVAILPVDIMPVIEKGILVQQKKKDGNNSNN